MLRPLRAEGLSDIELACVATNATSWEQRAPGFADVTLPIMIDTAGVFYIYGAESYDVILIDKLGRLVTKETYDGSDSLAAKIAQRLRELHAE